MRRFYAACALATLVGCGDDSTPPGVDAADDTADAADVGGDSDGAVDAPADADSSTLPDAQDVADTNDTNDVADVGPTEFLSTPEPVIQAGAAWAYEVELSRPAETVLWIGPDDAELEDSTLSWLPPETGVALADFSIDAVRAGETVATQSFTVEINHQPLFLDAPPANAFVGQEWEHLPSLSDEDSDIVAVNIVEGPDWLSVTEDGRVVGTPSSAGTASFVLRASDGRGGEATQASELSVVEPIRDLRANSYWTDTAAASFSIFGCCFTGAGPEVYWGGEELISEVVNAGRLDLSFDGSPRPGDQPVVLLVDGIVGGELPFPLSVLPAPSVGSGTVSLSGVAGAAVRVLDSDFAVLEETTPEADDWSSATHRGVVFVEVDGVISMPVWVADASAPELIALTPRLHTPSDVLTLEFSAPVAEPITVHWGEEEATCFVTEDRRCTATVPSRASGFLSVSSDGATVPALTSAIAGSPAGLGSGPWIDWANRSSLRAGVSEVVFVSTLGGAPTSADAAIELIELTETYALVWVTAEGPEASIELRGDRWTYSVE